MEEAILKEVKSIAIISNINFEPHFSLLIKKKFGSNVEILRVPYGEQKLICYQSIIDNASLVVVWLDFNVLFPDCLNILFSKRVKETDFIENVVKLCEQFYVDLPATVYEKIVWFLFEDYYTQFNHVVGMIMSFNNIVDEINNRLFHLFSDITFISTKRLIAEMGIINAYDNKNKYRWNTVYSKPLIKLAISEIYKQYLIKKGITKKCLILDCDNVLWGGIISEDGIENLRLSSSGLGKVYQDFQRFLLSLYYHGVILAVCSKNDLVDVLKMFREHSEMILKEEHIACFQVNWEDKPGNIKKISKILNIGLDSMVFCR